MKQILIFILLLFLKINSFSQDYMDKILKKSCECADKISDTMDIQKYNMEFGLCIINASMPFKKQLKKDYNIDLDNLNAEEGNKLGTTIGTKMGSFCPNSLLRLTQKAQSNKDTEKSDNLVEGVITNIENNNFVIFSLKDKVGKISKFYWLTFIDSKLELTTNYTSLVDQSVKITYEVQDFFDPKIGEYRQFFIIKKVEIISD